MIESFYLLSQMSSDISNSVNLEVSQWSIFSRTGCPRWCIRLQHSPCSTAIGCAYSHTTPATRLGARVFILAPIGAPAGATVSQHRQSFHHSNQTEHATGAHLCTGCAVTRIASRPGGGQSAFTISGPQNILRNPNVDPISAHRRHVKHRPPPDYHLTPLPALILKHLESINCRACVCALCSIIR